MDLFNIARAKLAAHLDNGEIVSIFAKNAYDYIKNGLSVLPVEGKRARVKEWSKYGLEAASEEQVDEWISECPNHNIGVLCGKASDVIAFDFDYNLEDAAVLSDTIKSILPNSPCVKFGTKGWTAFYKYNGIENSKYSTYITDNEGVRNKISVCEILSTGSQTVVPPSIHPESGRPYIWTGQVPLHEVDKSILPEITQSMIDEISLLINIFFSDVKPSFTSVGRHNRLLSYCFAVIEKRKDMDLLISEMTNKDKIWHKERAYFSDKKEFSRGTAQDNAKNMINSVIKTLARIKPNWVFGQGLDDGFYTIDIVEDKNGNIKEKKIPEYKLMAEHYLELGDYASSGFGDWIFEDNFWRSMDAEEINNIIYKENKKHIVPAHIDSFRKMMRSTCFIGAHNFKDIKGLVNLNNGILSVVSGALMEHSNKYFMKNKIPIDFDPGARCDRWLEFLNFIFEGNKELVEVAQRLFGYCLLGGNPFLHKAFVLYGSGRNGKSTFIDILRHILGEKSVSAVSMADINRPFSVVRMDGKLANIVEETPSDVINSEVFKAAVGGGLVTAAKKGLDEYDLRVEARLVFACNEMPIFKDKNVSMLDRLFMIPFSVYIEESERDTKMLEKLKSESPGILVWAIEGAKMMLLDRKIDAPEVSKELKEEYREESDQVYSWAKNNLDFTEQEDLSSDLLYSFYSTDTKEDGQFPLSKINFSRRLKKYIVDNNTVGLNKDQLKDFKIKGADGKFFRGYDLFKYKGTSRDNLVDRRFSLGRI